MSKWGRGVSRNTTSSETSTPSLMNNMLEISCLLSNALQVTRAETWDRTGMEQVQRAFKLTNLIGQFDWSRNVSVFHHVFFLVAFLRCDRTGPVASRSYICCCNWSEISDWWIFLLASDDSFRINHGKSCFQTCVTNKIILCIQQETSVKAVKCKLEGKKTHTLIEETVSSTCVE